ncbi:MAG TPA: hypothetical protein PLZ16_13835, partial [Gammaproteobacteria bacterium]|nr:hypothetical protein [Gammaproteobacteria bacterium]
MVAATGFGTIHTLPLNRIRIFCTVRKYSEAIDKIMLDRVHRVKFKNLTLDEKLVISNTHILPEVYEKM